MADRREYLDIGEFRRLGFLQEANRQFFHPHGLTLGVQTAVEPATVLVLRTSDVAALKTACAGHPSLLQRINEATTYEVGDSYLAAVEDHRNSLVGDTLGEPVDDKRVRAERVAVQRAWHRNARTSLFGSESDIEPIEWADQPKDEGGADA